MTSMSPEPVRITKGSSFLVCGLQVEQVASNFRTLGTLQRSQAHLMSIADRTDVPLAKIHHFLWDRFRGIRQDLYVQGYEVCSLL